MSTKRTVWDKSGTAYELTGKLGEGGQGMVCSTQFPNVLVKVSKLPTTDPRTLEWHRHLQWVARQPLEGLHIARPRALIVKPRLGYVMELMDGLEPLRTLMEQSHNALVAGAGLEGFLKTGGLRRRLRLLGRTARLLAQLHGRGLAYGDLSPTNVFVSKSLDQGEVWLIDCDNVTALSREGGQKLYTPDYGAPEIIVGTSGVNSLTDSWSFAVAAFQLLTLLHPMKGEYVTEGEPEIEESALRGELPWIDHPTDKRNESKRGLPRDIVLTPKLIALFDRCFNAGLQNAEARPTMAEWAEAFEAALALAVNCEEGDGCGSSFYLNQGRQCPFCDRVQSATRFLEFRHYVYAPLSELEAEALPKDRWLSTGHLQVLAVGEPVELRSSPVGASTHAESAPTCRLELKSDGLWIEPINSATVTLQRQGDARPQKLARKSRFKSVDAVSVLHLGDIEKTHAAWRFKY